jgi:ABC-type transport system involved in multi-copper enzyme maturation permease subunit
MIQAYTILLDSLRMLRASKLFWVSIWISTFVALVYASIGFTTTGISIGFGLFEFDIALMRKGTAESEMFYVMIFNFIVRFWLAWFSMALAFISTCSIFPKFLQTGSVELVLSRPISRLRLFTLKYMGGLMFVSLQTALFCLVAFVAIGLRVNEWNFTVFWAVPVITFSFSLIYCVGVLIGILTKSSVFALLGALLFWVMTLIPQWAEDFFYQKAYLMPQIGIDIDMTTGQLREPDEDSLNFLKQAHSVAQSVTKILPKSRQCTISLNRLIRFKERDSILATFDPGSALLGEAPDPVLREAMEKYELRHTWFSIIGTSLIFEILVLAGAATIFIRRDY